jgi:hypothetical protein
MKREFAILFAHMLLAALLCSLHHWVAITNNRGDYSPFAVASEVSSITFDETHAYAPLAQRFMSLGKLPAEVDNYERRNSSAGIPFAPGVILGGMGRVLGSLERAFIAADALFPALAFGLLYAASKGVVQSLRFRLLVAWGTLLIPWGVRNFLWSGYDALLAAPDFTRTPQPEISFTFLLLGLLLSARVLQSSATRATAVVAGLAGAVIVYSYYFYAIAWGIALGMLLVLTVVWRNWAIAKRIAGTLSVMIVASLPFILATARGRAEGGQTHLLARMGAFTHRPRVIPLLCCVLGVLLVWKFGERLFGGKAHQGRIAMFIVILLSGLAALNFQVLSGYDAQHPHFWNRLIFPVAFFLFGCWLLSAAESLTRHRRLFDSAALVILVCILLNAGARQVYAGTRIAEHQHASDSENELLIWARSNLPPESVVGTVDPDLILMIPAMGPNFTYVPTGLRSLTSGSEIVDRYYELASLLGLSAAEVESIAKSPAHATSRYVRLSQLLLVLSYAGTPQTFSEGYRRYRPEQGVQGRRLDYVVSNPGIPIPAGIAGHFIHARVLHVNQHYQLIGLR